MFIWTSNIPLIRLVIILNMNQRPLGDVSNSFQTRLLFPYQRKEGGGGGGEGGGWPFGSRGVTVEFWHNPFRFPPLTRKKGNEGVSRSNHFAIECCVTSHSWCQRSVSAWMDNSVWNYYSSRIVSWEQCDKRGRGIPNWIRNWSFNSELVKTEAAIQKKCGVSASNR